MRKKIEFKSVVDGKEVELAVIKPNMSQLSKGQMAYNEGFSRAVNSNAPLRFQVEKILRERNMWDDSKEAERRKLLTNIEQCEKALSKGGMKLSDARKIALDLKLERAKLVALESDRHALDTSTAEGQGEQERFNYFVAACTVYATSGDPVFQSVEDYIENADSQVAQDAAKNFALLQYGLDPEFEDKLPENKFLKKYKMVNNENRLIDHRTGEYVSFDGRRVDKEGFLLDEQNRRIDKDGNLLSDDGSVIAESASPFLDDDGTPIPD